MAIFVAVRVSVGVLMIVASVMVMVVLFPVVMVAVVMSSRVGMAVVIFFFLAQGRFVHFPRVLEMSWLVAVAV